MIKTKKNYRKRPIEKHNQDRLNWVSSYLKESRFWTGLSRKSFAEEKGLSRSALARAETGKNITLLTIFELCDLLEITPEEVFMELE